MFDFKAYDFNNPICLSLMEADYKWLGSSEEAEVTLRTDLRGAERKGRDEL